MNVSFACRNCEQPVHSELEATSTQLLCTSCNEAIPVADADYSGESLRTCLICGCQELYVRKDFPQRLGIAIVVCGFVASSVALAFHLRFVTYAILFATALIDLLLYLTVPNMLQCYRCQAVYRGLRGLEAFEPFKLETHEKFRQQQIRLAQNKK